MSGTIFKKEDRFLMEEEKEKDVGKLDPYVEHLRKLEKTTIDDCRELYGNRGIWECGVGWTVPLSRLSYSLESLNLTLGRRCGRRIVADQVKEKFGTLRFYFSIVRRYPWYTKIFSAPFTWASGFIRRHVNFKFRLEGWKRIPTRMFFLYSVSGGLDRIGDFLDLSFLIPETRAESVFSEYMDVTADRLVSEAESECFNYCEVCGERIGNRWHARCETKGWIRYVCEKCAKNTGWRYERVGGGEMEHPEEEVTKKDGPEGDLEPKENKADDNS